MRSKKLVCYIITMILVITSIPANVYASDGTRGVEGNPVIGVDDNQQDQDSTSQFPENPDEDFEQEQSTEENSTQETPDQGIAEQSPSDSSARASSATINDFDEVFKIEGAEIGGDTQSGGDHNLWFHYSYSSGGANLEWEKIKFVFTFPKGLNNVSGQAVITYNYEKSYTADDEEVITVTFRNEPKQGDGGDCTIFFKSKNGITPNEKIFPIKMDIIYDDIESTQSKEIEFQTKTDVFGWNNPVRTINPVNVTTDQGVIPSRKVTYRATNRNYNAAKGKANTKQVIIKDTFTVKADEVQLKQEDLVLEFFDCDVGEKTDVIVNQAGEIESFTIVMKVDNQNAEDDINDVSPSFAFSGAKIRADALAQAGESSIRINDFEASGLSMDTIAVVAVEGITEDADGEYKLTSNIATIGTMNAYYGKESNVGQPGNLEISKKVKSINGSTLASRLLYAYPGELVTYEIYGFDSKNDALDDFCITDTFDPRYSYPVSLTTGRYTASGSLLNRYEIILKDENGSEIATIPNIAFSQSTSIDLSSLVEDCRMIHTIEYQYGNVPSGFKVYSSSTNPQITAYVCYQDNLEDTEKKPDIENAAWAFYRIEDQDYEADSNVVTTKYYEVVPDDTDSHQKEINNLSRNSQKAYMPGDIVEYIITYTNKTGRDLTNLLLQDDYDTYALESYLNGNGVNIQEGYQDVNIHVSSDGSKNVTYKNHTDSNGTLYISMDGTLKKNEKLTITYVMKIRDDIADDYVINNSFKLWNAPGGTIENLITSGHNNSTLSKSIKPEISVSQAILHPDQTIHSSGNALKKGESVLVQVLIESTSVGSGIDSVHLQSMLPYIPVTMVDLLEISDCTIHEEGKAPYVLELDELSNAANSYQKLRLNLLDPDDPNSEGIEIAAGESVTIEYKITLTDEVQNLANLNPGTIRSQSIINYAFFKEMNTEYIRKSGTTTASPYTDANNLDNIAASKSYLNTSGYIYYQKELDGELSANMIQGTRYSSLEGTVSYIIPNRETARRRGYYTTITNNSEDQNLEIDQIVLRLPNYEEFSDKATIFYSETNKTYEISARSVRTVTGEDDIKRRIVEFSDLVDKEGEPIVSGEKIIVAPKKNIQVYCIAEVKQDLDEAIDRGYYYYDRFEWSFYSRQNLLNLKKVVDDENMGNNDFETRYTPSSPPTVYYYNDAVYPNIKIESQMIDSSNNYRDLNQGESFGLDSYIGWKTTIRNGSGTYTLPMANPIVSVRLPYGMKFEEFEEQSPAWLNSYVVKEVNGSQVLTMLLSHTVPLNGEFTFHFKTTALDCNYGIQTADVYLAPQEPVYPNRIYANTGIKEDHNLPGLTGAEQTDFPQFPKFDISKRSMVANQGDAPVFGRFAFTSSKAVQDNDTGKKALSGTTVDSLMVKRDISSFTYTLNVKNTANDTYEQMTIIDRLPGESDLHSFAPTPRNSNMDVVLSSVPKVSIIDESLNEIPLTSEQYTLEYTSVSKTTPFAKEEYKPDSSGLIDWTEINLEKATAFRIRLKNNNNNGLKGGETVVVTYEAQFPSEIPEEDAVAVNSFGFAFQSRNTYVPVEAQSVTLKANDLVKGSISGQIFMDKNEDGNRDTDETLYFNDLKISLYKSGGLVQTAEVSNGVFEFDDLYLGDDYSLSVEVPEDYVVSPGTISEQIFDNEGKSISNIELTELKPHQERDLGLKDPKGTVWGDIFLDADKNMNYNTPPDSLITENVTVKLIDNNSSEIVDTMSTTSGSYRFEEVEYGDYRVEISSVSGYNLTLGIHPDNTGNKFNHSYETEVFTIQKLDKIHQKNAGFIIRATALASIEGIIFIDDNKNGTYDAGELIYPNVKLELIDHTGEVIGETSTDESGYYAFIDLTTGTYKVKMTKPSGYALVDKTGLDVLDNKFLSDSYLTEEISVTEFITYYAYGGIYKTSGGGGGGNLPNPDPDTDPDPDLTPDPDPSNDPDPGEDPVPSRETPPTPHESSDDIEDQAPNELPDNDKGNGQTKANGKNQASAGKKNPWKLNPKTYGDTGSGWMNLLYLFSLLGYALLIIQKMRRSQLVYSDNSQRMTPEDANFMVSRKRNWFAGIRILILRIVRKRI